MGVITVAALVTVGSSAPAAADLASPRSPVDSACLDRWLATRADGGRNVNGIGSFWIVRALALYGEQKGRLVQVQNPPLTVHAWMNNLALYHDTEFSYVIADDIVSGRDLRRILGAPATAVACTGFVIYDYRGTAGERKLNSAISKTLAIVESHRG